MVAFMATDSSNTLYPKLDDHELVHQYPEVVGMHQSLFFLWVHIVSPNDANCKGTTRIVKEEM
jgi:hypothetical protein